MDSHGTWTDIHKKTNNWQAFRVCIANIAFDTTPTYLMNGEVRGMLRVNDRLVHAKNLHA